MKTLPPVFRLPAAVVSAAAVALIPLPGRSVPPDISPLASPRDSAARGSFGNHISLALARSPESACAAPLVDLDSCDTETSLGASEPLCRLAARLPGSCRVDTPPSADAARALGFF